MRATQGLLLVEIRPGLLDRVEVEGILETSLTAHWPRGVIEGLAERIRSLQGVTALAGESTLGRDQYRDSVRRLRVGRLYVPDCLPQSGPIRP